MVFLETLLLLLLVVPSRQNTCKLILLSEDTPTFNWQNKNRWLLVYQHLVGLGLIGQNMSRYFDVLLFFSNIYGDKDFVSNKGYSNKIVVILQRTWS